MITERTQEQFLQTMLSNLSNSEDKTPNSFSYDILSATAVVFEDMQRSITELFRHFDVNYLHGEDLDERVHQLAGLYRKLATRAHGKIHITGTPGTIIEEGTIFKAGEVEFFAIQESTIEDTGQILIEVESNLYGVSGNVAARTINTLARPNANITSVYNPKAFENGFYEESDDDLRERFYDVMENPPKAGNPAHYKLWATEVPGIWTAKVFRTYDGPLTTRVVVVSSDRGVVGEDKIAEVREHILEEAPIRAEGLLVESAKGKSMNFTFSLAYVGDKDSIIQEIERKIDEYFRSVSFQQDYISIAKVGSLILSVEGVSDYEGLTINGSMENSDLETNEIPVLGTMEVSEYE